MAACKPVDTQSPSSSVVQSVDDGYPQSFQDWLKYEDITEEQQRTVDAIFEVSTYLGIEKNDKGANKIANGQILDLGNMNITNLDPVLSLKRLSTLYLLPNPLSQEEINKLDVLTELDQLIIPTKLKCPSSLKNRIMEICTKKKTN